MNPEGASPVKQTGRAGRGGRRQGVEKARRRRYAGEANPRFFVAPSCCERRGERNLRRGGRVFKPFRRFVGAWPSRDAGTSKRGETAGEGVFLVSLMCEADGAIGGIPQGGAPPIDGVATVQGEVRTDDGLPGWHDATLKRAQPQGSGSSGQQWQKGSIGERILWRGKGLTTTDRKSVV